MTRITRAAQTLVDQILAQHEDAQIENHDEPDGLGVIRGLRVLAPVGKEVMEALIGDDDERPIDPRIESFNYDDKSGDLTVNFIVGNDADLRDEFALEWPQADQEAPSAPTETKGGAKGRAAAKKAAAAKKPEPEPETPPEATPEAGTGDAAPTEGGGPE